ncbi:MAG: tetratricopeptide repeat protein [Puniceicoccales bacterium]|jgi:hypothetical protein|nr:tetratricopeptide repeat protein [Puniceicoccales bacterium]
MPNTTPGHRAAALALLAALGAPAAIPSAPVIHARQEAPESARHPSLADDVAGHIPALSKLLDASNFQGLLDLIDQSILPAAKPGSFDQALFLQIRGQALLNLGRPLEAIAPLEESLGIAAGKNWFDASVLAQVRQTLSQLHYQKYSELPASAGATRRRAVLDDAQRHAKQWLALAGPRPNPDIFYYAATLDYAAGTLDPEKPGRPALEASLAAAGESLARRPALHEASLLLAAAIHQQLGDSRAVAEHLEVLLARDPRNPVYWRQLFAIYIGLATEARTPSQVRLWQARALLTQRRARELLPASATPAQDGRLDTPQDYLNTTALLFSLGQHDEAALTLEDALATGRLPPTRQHWELLASAWQRHREPSRAMAALERAVAQTPDDPELRLHLARLLLHGENPKAAFAQTSAAVALTQNREKPAKFASPAEAWFLHAYAAYEHHDFSAATAALDTAAAQPGASRLDASIRQLRQAVAAVAK